MKKFFGFLIFSALSVSCAYAADVVISTAPQVATYSGDIIDNTCVQSNQNNLANIAPTYSKDNALMPGCAKSGYSLYTTEGKLLEFGNRSNKKVEEFLKKPYSTVRVTVTGRIVNNKLSLTTIENQK